MANAPKQKRKGGDDFEGLKSMVESILDETRSAQACTRRLVEQGHDEIAVRAAVEAVINERRDAARDEAPGDSEPDGHGKRRTRAPLAEPPRMTREQVQLSLYVQGILATVAAALLANTILGGFHPLVAVIGFPGYFFEPAFVVAIVGYIVWKRLTD